MVRLIRSRVQARFVTLIAAVIAAILSAASAQADTAKTPGYTVPTVGKITAGQAGVIFDNTTPLDWTGHLTAGGFGSRVVPKVTDWFTLPACESATQLYCISVVSLGGTALQPLPSVTAVDNNPLARSASNIKTGIVTRWASTDGKSLLAVNSYASFRCDLNCTLPDVSHVATDVRAYKVVKGTNYRPLGFWDVYSALMGGHPEDQQLYRDCAWLDKGTCGKIVSLPNKQITVTLQLPQALRTAFAGPDVLTGHLDNVYATELPLGTNPAAGGVRVRSVTVTGTPATVGYFAGVLAEPLPSWAVEGRTTIINPEDGNTLPITSNGTPTGANSVWQFALNEAASGNDSSSCLGKVQGTAVVIGTDSSNAGSFDWIATNDARFSTQDYPKNINYTDRLVQARVMLRNDFASCMTTNKPDSPLALSAEADFKLGTAANSVKFSQEVDSNNSTWLIKDLVYPAQVTSTINLTLHLSSAPAAATGNSLPKSLSLLPQKYSILCSKKSGKDSYTAKATGFKPKCPAGYKNLGFVPTN